MDIYGKHLITLEAPNLTTKNKMGCIQTFFPVHFGNNCLATYYTDINTKSGLTISIFLTSL